jgi:hypothetical protein
MRTSMTTNDVEKRWHDPAAFRAASVYVASIIAVAGLAFVLFLLIGREVPLWALGTPIVLLVGGIAAFIKTYRIWRAGGTWPIWQGAGWFLLTLMLVSLSIPGMAISR